jgi:hypothetical protein
LLIVLGRFILSNTAYETISLSQMQLSSENAVVFAGQHVRLISALPGCAAWA